MTRDLDFGSSLLRGEGHSPLIHANIGPVGDGAPGLDLEAGGRELLDGSDAFEIAGADLPLTVLKIPFRDERSPSARCLRKRSKLLPTADLIAI